MEKEISILSEEVNALRKSVVPSTAVHIVQSTVDGKYSLFYIGSS